MRIRIWLLLTAAALLCWCAPESQAQSTKRANRFTAVPKTGKITPAVPLGSKREMTVVLKLAGDPVALVRAQAPGKRMPQAAEKAVEQQLRAQQDALMPLIEAHGVKVLAKFQHAINGIKVRGTVAQINSLARLPGIVGVKAVLTHTLGNAESVPFIGAPAVWQGPPGLHGEHVKLAIIDTGIDYTHANFGGPGTPAAFAAAFATNTLAADPALFGPGAPRVKGGTDLVGDAYDANNPASVPMPDPNPLDCNGHGSHTAGTAAGSGVTAAGNTFTGPYDATTPSNQFIIGPGVAPMADIYAVRVFGCSGSTNVVVDAIDWAVMNHMDVVSMSLGAPFGTEDSADAEASENAVASGVVVVAASGNAGFAPYITSSPAAGENAISVAAMDSRSGFPGANIALSTGGSIQAQDSDGFKFMDGTMLPVFVLLDSMGNISLGCNESEYVDALITGKLVVTQRGVCARILRAQFGQKHGAAAVAMINNASGFPPFEGPIPGVAIPFFGINGGSGPTSDGGMLAAAASVTLTNAALSNPSFRQFASFTSSGPRTGDGHLKPDVSGPGVSIFSTLIGSGNQGLFESGTSMATPHVAGSAALTVQAHPGWQAVDLSRAVVNTADSTQLFGYSPRLGGNGLVQPFPATRTSVIAWGDSGGPSESFGVVEFGQDGKREGDILVRNLGTHHASFTVAANATNDTSPHTVSVQPSFLSIPGGQIRKVHIKLDVPAGTSGDSSDFRQVAGLVTLTPASHDDNNGVTLNVPYYMVARARSDVEANLQGKFNPSHPMANVVAANHSKAVAGSADFYAWGLSGVDMNQGSTDVRAVGVQSFDAGAPLGELLVFAVNNFRPWSTAATKEFDILLDIDGSGKPEYQIIGFDLGAITTGSFNGQVASFVLNLSTNAIQPEFLAIAPTDEATILLAVVAADVGITPGNPRFTYVADCFDVLSSDASFTTGLGQFNAFNNAVSTAAFAFLPPGTQSTVPLAIDPVEFAITPAMGVMIVSLENFSQFGQAQLKPIH